MGSGRSFGRRAGSCDGTFHKWVMSPAIALTPAMKAPTQLAALPCRCGAVLRANHVRPISDWRHTWVNGRWTIKKRRCSCSIPDDRRGSVSARRNLSYAETAGAHRAVFGLKSIIRFEGASVVLKPAIRFGGSLLDTQSHGVALRTAVGMPAAETQLGVLA
jgi:hypothetical protein